MEANDFFKKASEKIKFIIIDSDGVLNDRSIQITESGHTVKTFDVHDCIALQMAKSVGIHVDILTFRVTEIMKKFSERWGIEGVHSIMDGRKEKNLEDISLRMDITFDQMLYIGDDVDDLPCICRAGFSACPGDAVIEVKSICDYVATSPGGRGAIREIIEGILKSKNAWPVLNFIIGERIV